jgi:prepilin-type N-terminal cleavage/methylation domain-containing protein
MKGRIALRRHGARSSRGGYSLIELMVVVVLIALMAMLAAPSLTVARNDKLAFSYARQTSELAHNARARAAGRGSAHLFVYTNEWGTRGGVYVFEALDGTASPSGPNPTSGCKTPGQWAYVPSFTPGGTDGANKAIIVDAVNPNDTAGGAIEATENILLTARELKSDGTVSATPNAFVICTTPNGTTWYGSDTGVKAAIDNMQKAQQPFLGVVEVDVSRNDAAGANTIGLIRRVIIPAGGSPRIKSENKWP